ncbi:MAG: bifunctional diguanylate cyclase/phosphodiesterase [Sulfuricaulis sp.]|nr:bifunctional diguanylate cyclase/phosphodiesterase [Sulfuricaulis sp.]
MDLRLGIKSRIFGAYLLVLALGAVLAFLVYTDSKHVADTSRQLTGNVVPQLNAINALKLDLLMQESVLYRYYINLDHERFLADYERIDNACVSGFVNLAEALDQRLLLQSVQGDYNRLGQIGRNLDAALKNKPRNTKRAAKLLSEAGEVVGRIHRELDVLAGDISSRVQQSGARASSTVETMQRRVILFAGAIFLISLFVGYYINVYINEQTERRRLAMFPERNPNPVLQLSPAGAVLYANPGTAELLKKIGAVSNDVRALLPLDLEKRLTSLRAKPASHELWEYTVEGGRTLECGIHWLPDLEIFHVYVTDVTERKRAQEGLIHQAYHDALTKLPNRLMFEEEFERRVYANDRAGMRAALLLMGVDRFRVVIESMGHDIGDLLLQAVVARLKHLLGEVRGQVRESTLYRMEGDRFAILVPGFATSQNPVWLAEQILEEMQQPFHALGREYHLSLSIGISVYPLDGQEAATLLRNAEAAMQRAKRQGGAGLECYTRDMNERAAEWLALENELRHAEEHGELRLYYQPQVDIASGRVIGAEALLRWEHPKLGLLVPSQFLALSEESGLVVSLGEWALYTACAQAAAADTPETRGLSVSVNISARQFALPDLAKRVAAVLQDTGLSPTRLELEITEGVAMQDIVRTIGVLTELKKFGVKFAVDDFGTGFSSLSYLKRFPLDKLKIDQSFVRGLPADENDAAITRAVIALGQSLKLKVIAEGVETRKQLDLLREQGCNEYQGDFFSKPVPIQEFDRLLAHASAPA